MTRIVKQIETPADKARVFCIYICGLGRVRFIRNRLFKERMSFRFSLMINLFASVLGIGLSMNKNSVLGLHSGHRVE